MNRIGILSALALIVCVGCNSAATSETKDERTNFQSGMTPQRAKEIGPAPKPPSGPQKPYTGGSAADKALGR